MNTVDSFPNLFRTRCITVPCGERNPSSQHWDNVYQIILKQTYKCIKYYAVWINLKVRQWRR